MNLLEFNGIDDEVLKSLITNVEIMNSKNMASEYVNTSHRKAINMKNKLVDVFGKGKRSKIPEEISLDLLTENLIEELEILSREELEYRLKKSLYDRISKDYSLSEWLDETELEREMLLITSGKHKIDTDLSKSRKIELISLELKKDFSKIISEKISKMDEIQEKKFDDLINQELSKASPEAIKTMKSHLNIESLNSEAIRGILKSSGGALAFLAIPAIGGFSSYVAMTTIMHALFTTLLGITLPFVFYTSATSLLAFLTGPIGWIGAIGLSAFSLKNSRKNMTNTIVAQVIGILSWIYEEEVLREIKESLPSNQSDKKYEELEKFRKEIKKYESEISKLRIELNQRDKNIELVSKEEQSIEMEKNRLINNENFLKEELNKLRASKKDLGIKNKNTENDNAELLETLLEKEDEYEEMINQSIKDRLDLIIKVEKYKKENEEMAKEKKRYKNKIEKLSFEQNEKIEFKVKDLQRKWEKYYKRLEINRKAIKNVVKKYQYSREHMENIEVALIDIDYSRSSYGTNNERGRIRGTGEQHVSFEADNTGRIFYTVLNVEQDQIKKKRINRIGEHPK